MHRTFLLVAALAAPLLAQSPVSLIGLTRTTPRLIRTDMATCAIQVCSPAIAPAVTLPYAGGTAHDSTSGITWVSNGPTIGGFDPMTCATRCAPFAAPVPAGTVVTGLACYEPQFAMFVTDSGNGITRLRLTTCPPVVALPRCVVTGLQPNHVIGGIAASDTQGIVFYSGSDWTASGAPNNFIYVATVANPCVPVCKFPVQGCSAIGFGAITGVAYDDCKGVIWMTDGRQVMGAVWNRATCTAPQIVQCCMPAGLPEPFVGLCVNPSHAASLGTSCTNPVCPACPLMAHTTVGDPTIGNPAFGLRLDNAPALQSAWLLLNVGSCGPGIALPPWCGPFRVPIPGIFVLGPVGTGGTVGCTGALNLGLAIPNNPAFCGLRLATQYLVFCQSTAGFGTGVSNCLSWQITGS